MNRKNGFRDRRADTFSKGSDVNGIVWERFTPRQQADEINDLWLDARYQPE